MKKSVGFALALVLTAAFVGCSGGGGGGGDDDDDDDGGSDNVVAQLVQGATAPAAFALAGGGPPTDGLWRISPEQVQVTITRVNFQGATEAESTGADLVGCTATFDRSQPSLTALGSCSFNVAAGSYTSMNMFTDPVAQILISDAVNGIFTDAASATGLSSIEPAGGAALVPVTTEFGGGFETFFTAPLVIGSGAGPVQLSFVIDAMHTADVTVSGGGTTLTFGDYFPARVFPTIGDPGTPQYFSSLSNGDSYNNSVGNPPHHIRVYYGPGADPQPVRLSLDQLAMQINACQAGGFGYVFPGDAATSPPSSSGDRAGGWLGIDSSGTLCGAVGDDSEFTGYHSYFTMPYITTVGATALFRCEMTDTPTPPASGTTYASGCPAHVAVLGSANLFLVAD